MNPNEFNSNKSTDVILSNPFISAPVQFDIEQTNEGLVVSHTFLNERKSYTERTQVTGSIVANPNAIGASAMVIPTHGYCHGSRCQRLLLKTSSPHAAASARTIDFFPILGSNLQSNPKFNSSNLGLRISDGLLPSTTDSGTVSGSTLPLIVGPESAVIGTIDHELLTREENLELNFGDVFSVVKRVVPVIAKSGYEIYQELKDTNTQEEFDRLKASSENGIFDLVKSVAKIAVPVAGTILGSL